MYLDDLEISEYMKMAGLMWPKHQKLISAHYSMDQMAGTVLWDSSGNEHNGTIFNAKWVKVSDSQTIRFCSVPWSVAMGKYSGTYLGCLPVREKSGNSVFPRKVWEKSGNLDKSQGKVRESFLRAANFRKSVKISMNFKFFG